MATSFGENREGSTARTDAPRDAGRALDALVDEKVFAHRIEWSGGFAFRRDVLGDFRHGDLIASCHSAGAVVPDYSTDIADAWLVWERASGGFRRLTLYEEGGSTFGCEVWEMMEDGTWACLAEEEAHTAPLAICRAALNALEAES